MRPVARPMLCAQVRCFMSVIDRALQELQTGRVEPPTLSVPDAMAAILIASASIDGALSVDESSRIGHIVSASRLFKGASGTGGAGALERAVALLQEHGVDAVLLAAADVLPPELHAPAFAVAVDLLSNPETGLRSRYPPGSARAVISISISTMPLPVAVGGYEVTSESGFGSCADTRPRTCGGLPGDGPA